MKLIKKIIIATIVLLGLIVVGAILFRFLVYAKSCNNNSLAYQACYCSCIKENKLFPVGYKKCVEKNMCYAIN